MLFCRKLPMNTRHPITLRHPIASIILRNSTRAIVETRIRERDYFFLSVIKIKIVNNKKNNCASLFWFWIHGETILILMTERETIFITCEVATMSRLPKNIGLFCKRALLKRLYSAEETYIKEPTNHSHPIVVQTYEVGLHCIFLLVHR